MRGHLICLEHGKKLTMLKRYLKTHYNLSPLTRGCDRLLRIRSAWDAFRLKGPAVAKPGGIIKRSCRATVWQGYETLAA